MARPRLIRLDDIEGAFPNAQTGGIKLVLTQSTYLLQRWVDTLDGADRIIATADRVELERIAPEASQKRGAWRLFDVIDLGRADTDASSATLRVAVSSQGPEPLLVRAFQSPDAEERFQLCRTAVATFPNSAVSALALASACREQQDIIGARNALALAVERAPDWEAIHYEEGKLWLSLDQMEQAGPSVRSRWLYDPQQHRRGEPGTWAARGIGNRSSTRRGTRARFCVWALQPGPYPASG